MPCTFVEMDQDAPSSATSYVCFQWCCRTGNHPVIQQASDAKVWSVVDEPLDRVAVRAGAYYGEGKSRLFDRKPRGTTDQLERQKSPDTRGNSLASLELYVKAPMEQSHLFLTF